PPLLFHRNYMYHACMNRVYIDSLSPSVSHTHTHTHTHTIHTHNTHTQNTHTHNTHTHETPSHYCIHISPTLSDSLSLSLTHTHTHKHVYTDRKTVLNFSHFPLRCRDA